MLGTHSCCPRHQAGRPVADCCTAGRQWPASAEAGLQASTQARMVSFVVCFTARSARTQVASGTPATTSAELSAWRSASDTPQQNPIILCMLSDASNKHVAAEGPLTRAATGAGQRHCRDIILARC